MDLGIDPVKSLPSKILGIYIKVILNNYYIIINS